MHQLPSNIKHVGSDFLFVFSYHNCSMIYYLMFAIDCGYILAVNAFLFLSVIFAFCFITGNEKQWFIFTDIHHNNLVNKSYEFISLLDIDEPVS